MMLVILNSRAECLFVAWVLLLGTIGGTRVNISPVSCPIYLNHLILCQKTKVTDETSVCMIDKESYHRQMIRMKMRQSQSQLI